MDPPVQAFDPSAVFEVFERDVQVGDLSYPADTIQLFRTTDVLPDLYVNALVTSGADIYAGTPSGLMRLSQDRQSFVAVAGVSGNITSLELAQGALLAASAHHVHVLDIAGALTSDFAVQTATVTSVAVDRRARLVLGTQDALLIADSMGVVTGTVSVGLAVRDILIIGEIAYLATIEGVQRVDLTALELMSPWKGLRQLADNDVRALAEAAQGPGVWVASAYGLAKVTRGSGEAEIIIPGIESGLVAGDIRALAQRAGILLLGHQIGATAFISDKVEHYHSLRWLPDEQVNAVAVDSRGDKWVGTPDGIARLSTEDTTLAARAQTNEDFLQAKHWRMDGFVDDRIRVDDEWAPTEIITGDHDNDGLWTEMQIGAWCYAYAVTGEERFYESAHKALQVMFLQIDIPGETFKAAGLKRGFITRSLVREDEGEVFTSKATQDNWHLQSWKGQDYYWKDDTSSDEYAGHYFGLPVYYDLCAKDDAERTQVADYMRAATDYVIAGSYVLIDLDGESTLHGHWEDLAIGVDGVDACVDRYGIERAADCLSSKHGGGWLNATELLGMLLSTWHVTGDQEYYDEYQRLFANERYGELINITEEVLTVARPAFANHSDHELGMLAYTTLLRYEPNPSRRAQYVQSMLDMYEYEREEHNPWQVAVIAGAHPGEVDTDAAVKSLQDMPLDWRTWRIDNSHRQDAGRWPTDRHGDAQFSRVFPYDEIRTMKWNGSPYVVAGGGSGKGILAPTPYLLAYWMLRYHKVLNF